MTSPILLFDSLCKTRRGDDQSYTPLPFSLQDKEGRKFARGQTMVEPADHLLTVDMGRGGGREGIRPGKIRWTFPLNRKSILHNSFPCLGKVGLCALNLYNLLVCRFGLSNNISSAARDIRRHNDVQFTP
jgi:hypothetical protein